MSRLVYSLTLGNFNPNAGILWKIKDSLNEFILNRQALETYILVLDGGTDWTSLLGQITNDKSISGVIVLNNELYNYTSISMDSKSPNHDYGLYRNSLGYEWNQEVCNGFKSKGLDLLEKRFDIPIMFIGGSNTSLTRQTVGTLRDVKI